MIRHCSVAFIAVLAALSITVSACGGDDGNANSSQSEATAAPQVDPETAARTALEDFYAAQRAGDAETICALESEAYKDSFYNASSCLEETGNSEPSDVVKEKIKIEILEVAEDSVETLVYPTTTGVRVYITVRLIDGEWLLDSIELA